MKQCTRDHSHFCAGFWRQTPSLIIAIKEITVSILWEPEDEWWAYKTRWKWHLGNKSERDNKELKIWKENDVLEEKINYSSMKYVKLRMWISQPLFWSLTAPNHQQRHSFQLQLHFLTCKTHSYTLHLPVCSYLSTQFNVLDPFVWML